MFLYLAFAVQCAVTCEHTIPSSKMPERIVYQAPVDAPALWRQARISGFVKLQIRTDESGAVECARLISGHPIIVSAVMESLKHWKFKPWSNAERSEPICGILLLHVDSDFKVVVIGSD